MNLDYYQIPDFSFWQDDPTTSRGIDFAQTRQKTRGVILRASQGVWADNEYVISARNAKAAGMLVGNYHYYDNRYPPKRQAETWAAIIRDDECTLGAWLDLEQDMAGQYKGYKHWWDCVEYFKQLKPNVEIGIYTRASYFNDPAFSIPVNHAFRFLPLWVAHYNKFVTHPDLPKGWTTWDFWQITDDHPSEGWGTESNEIDLNYFNGSEADFAARYGITSTPEAVGHMTANFGQTKVEYKKQ